MAKVSSLGFLSPSHCTPLSQSELGRGLLPGASGSENHIEHIGCSLIAGLFSAHERIGPHFGQPP